MSYIFLDDERLPHKVTWVELPLHPYTVLRSYNEFVEHITKHGLPKFISYDHDLNDSHYQEGRKNLWQSFDYSKVKEKTGYDCAKWLVEYCMDNKLPLPEWMTHSMNPVGSDNINALLNSFKRSYVPINEDAEPLLKYPPFISDE